jgi:polyphosphate glucokinase
VDVFGIDIGGSGIKGAPVNLKTGDLLEEGFASRRRRPLPPRRWSRRRWS